MSNEARNTAFTRTADWLGAFATAPQAAGWAREAVVFVRALAAHGPVAVLAKVQISPDGVTWVDEGTSFTLPYSVDEITFAKVRHFGGWLRIVGVLPPDASLRAAVTIDLKA